MPGQHVSAATLLSILAGVSIGGTLSPAHASELDDAIAAFLSSSEHYSLVCESALSSDPSLVPFQFCELAKEPASPASGPSFTVRLQRMQEVDDFCASPRARQVTNRTIQKRAASRDLTEAALNGTSPEEVQALLGLAADPYAEDAINLIAQIPFETEARKACQSLAEVTRTSVLMSSDYSWQGSNRPGRITMEDTLKRECGGLDPGSYDSPVPRQNLLPSCHEPVIPLPSYILCAPQESGEACAKRKAEAAQKELERATAAAQERERKCEADARQEEEAELARQQEAEAARRQAFEEKEAAFTQCKASVRARIEDEAAKSQALKDEEALTKADQAKFADYQRCMTMEGQTRLAAFCNEAPADDLTSAWYVTARKSPACKGKDGKPIALKGDGTPRNPESFRKGLGWLVSSYGSQPIETRLSNCREKMQQGASICDKLETAATAPSPAIDRIYTPVAMASAKSHFEGILQSVDAWIDSTSIPPSEKAKLHARVQGVQLVAPTGSAGLEQLTRSGGGFFICGYSEKQGADDPCQAKQMQLSPEFLLALASDDPAQQASVLPAIVHELGHGLVPLEASSRTPFENLASCLNSKVSKSKFYGGNQGTVEVEAIADWIAGEVIAGQVAGLGADASQGQKLKMTEDHLAPLLCGVLSTHGPNACDSEGFVYGSGKPAVFPTEIPLLASQECRSYAAEMDHPQGPDRANIFFSSRSLKKSLGCPADSSNSSVRNRSCSL